MPKDDYERTWYLMNAMSIYGGSFAKAIADAWFKADPINKSKIEATWPEMIKENTKFIKDIKFNEEN